MQPFLTYLKDIMLYFNKNELIKDNSSEKTEILKAALLFI
jgi:hypothetical protein